MDWDLTPDGPVKATSYLTVSDSIKILKMLYGETRNDNEDELYFPPHWGSNNREIVLKWLHFDKLNQHHKAELGIREDFVVAEQIESNQNDGASDNSNNGRNENEQEPQEDDDHLDLPQNHNDEDDVDTDSYDEDRIQDELDHAARQQELEEVARQYEFEQRNEKPVRRTRSNRS